MSIEQTFEKEKVYTGAIILFYRKDLDEIIRYLVVKNAETGNITFISGAKEDTDESTEAAAQREIQEELGLGSSEYQLIKTQQKQEFIFGPKKKDRAGHKGCYDVFLADGSSLSNTPGYTSELENAEWLTKEEVEQKLSFPDLKEIFMKAISEIT